MLWMDSVCATRYQAQKVAATARAQTGLDTHRDAELVVECVGGHRAEHGDHHHRRPVGERVVPSCPKLNPQGECETRSAENEADETHRAD